MGSLTSDSTSQINHAGSAFAHVPEVPEVPIHAVMSAYKKDPNPLKLNLGIGVYRTEEGEPFVMPVVREAEQLLLNDPSTTKEYIFPTGMPEFRKLTAELIFGHDSPAIIEKRVTTIQCFSANGALRVGAEFLAKNYKHHVVYISQPTYGNHPNFFIAVGMTVKTYRYYDTEKHCLDFQGLMDDLSSAPPGAIVLLQACAHNPTGVDPTLQQWEQIRQLMRSKQLLPVFDIAYQGLASGNISEDAKPVCLFVADGGECLVVQSYSKNMGLYAERVGSLSIVCKTPEIASGADRDLLTVIFPMYLTPALHGASIVIAILKNRHLYEKWDLELKAMNKRLSSTRQLLFDALCNRGTPGNWSHIVKEVGMFTISGLSESQVHFMAKEYHIYMSFDGRINLAGLGPKKIPYLADAIHAAVTHVPGKI